MNKQKQIEEEVLKIGIKAKEASLKISLLSSQKKNDVLLDAADNIKKNKKLINLLLQLTIIKLQCL